MEVAGARREEPWTGTSAPVLPSSVDFQILGGDGVAGCGDRMLAWVEEAAVGRRVRVEFSMTGPPLRGVFRQFRGGVEASGGGDLLWR